MIALTILNNICSNFFFLFEISDDEDKHIRRNEIIRKHWGMAFHHIKNSASSSSLKTFKPESLRKTFCIPYFLCNSPIKITFSRYNSEMNKEKLQ